MASTLLQPVRPRGFADRFPQGWTVLKGLSRRPKAVSAAPTDPKLFARYRREQNVVLS